MTDVFFVKRLESQRNNMLKTLVKCMTKTAEDSVKEAVTRKQDQHILLKVQDTDLAAREEITLERMTDPRKPSKTLKPLKSKLPTRPYKHYFQYIVQYVIGRIKRLPR